MRQGPLLGRSLSTGRRPRSDGPPRTRRCLNHRRTRSPPHHGCRGAAASVGTFGLPSAGLSARGLRHGLRRWSWLGERGTACPGGCCVQPGRVATGRFDGVGLSTHAGTTPPPRRPARSLQRRRRRGGRGGRARSRVRYESAAGAGCAARTRTNGSQRSGSRCGAGCEAQHAAWEVATAAARLPACPSLPTVLPSVMVPAAGGATLDRVRGQTAADRRGWVLARPTLAAGNRAECRHPLAVLPAHRCVCCRRRGRHLWLRQAARQSAAKAVSAGLLCGSGARHGRKRVPSAKCTLAAARTLFRGRRHPD